MKRVLQTFAAFGALATPLALHAATQWWNPTAGRTAGDGVWSTSVSAWANSTAAADILAGARVAWVSGNDANFSMAVNPGTAFTVTVDGVTASSLTFNNTNGDVTLAPGVGPLILRGPVINSNGHLRFETDVELENDQEWAANGSRDIFVYGGLSGDYLLRKTGARPLIVSNANITVKNLHITAGNLEARGGDFPIVEDGLLTLGSTNQPNATRLDFYPLNDRVASEWELGTLVANGYGVVRFDNNYLLNTRSNIVTFAGLGRVERGVLNFNQGDATADFNVRQNVCFTNTSNFGPGGMLPPWVVTAASSSNIDHYHFLRQDNGVVKNVAHTKTTSVDYPASWGASDIVLNNNATRPLTGDTAVHAMKLTAGLTIPVGMTLTNMSGGFLFANSSTISGGGEINCGANDLVAFVRNGYTGAINTPINANGLTVWGAGTLLVSNMTWSGETYIQQGNLRVNAVEDLVIGNDRNIRGALGNGGAAGNFQKEGPGSLTFDGSTNRFGRLVWTAGPSITMRDSVVHTLASGGTTFPANGGVFHITNSVFRFAGGACGTPGGISNTKVEVINSIVEGTHGFVVGQNNGHNNTLIVDGRGVTGGAAITNTVYNTTGLRVGYNSLTTGGSTNNLVRIINGGQVWDYITVNDVANSHGHGVGANSNRIEVVGGPGFVSRLYKGFPNVLGSGAGTYGNVLLVDGKGVPGSAVYQVGGGQEVQVGNGGATNNHLIVKDGGQIIGGSFRLGSTASFNTVKLTGAGTSWTGAGADGIFRLGLPSTTIPAISNLLYIADGARLTNFSKNSNAGIGGMEDGTSSGQAIGNRIWVDNGGYYQSPINIVIGRTRYAGSVAQGNALIVSGAGSTNILSNNLNIYVGLENSSSQAFDNQLIVENEGYCQAPYVVVGSRNTTTPEGDSHNNRVIVRDCGHLYIYGSAGADPTYELRIGGNNASFHPRDNKVEVYNGGVLDANKIKVFSPSNNTLRVYNGGVWQVRTRAPAITSLTHGDLSITNGVLSFFGVSNVEVRDNWNYAGFRAFKWSGNNALRLTGINTANNANNGYLFEPNIGSTNYFRLEMVGVPGARNTGYLGTSGTLQIGSTTASGAEMLCSNTTARVTLPFICNGTLTLFNSTLQLENASAINGKVVVDFADLAAGRIVLTTAGNGSLTLGPQSTVQINGLPRKPGPGEPNSFTFANNVGNGRFRLVGAPAGWSVKQSGDEIFAYYANPSTRFLVR